MINICLINILCAFSWNKKNCLTRHTIEAPCLIKNAKLKFSMSDVLINKTWFLFSHINIP